MIPRASIDVPRAARLDKMLAAAFPWLSRADLAALLATADCRLDGHPIPRKKGYRLPAGTVLTVSNVPEARDLRPPPNPDLPLNVLHEDPDFFVLDKPAGLPSNSLRSGDANSLVSALLARHPELADIGPDPLAPAILHRLDAPTSGLLLAARTPAAYAEIRRQFAALAIEKHYLAWVRLPDSSSASPPPPGRCNAPLTHQSQTPCRMRPVLPGERIDPRDLFPASTAWRTLRVQPPFALLDVTIFSGVTHQIRCHLAAAGLPILGDATYAPSPVARAAPRLLLHSHAIRFRHPTTRAPLAFTAPPPPDFLPPA